MPVFIRKVIFEQGIGGSNMTTAYEGTEAEIEAYERKQEKKKTAAKTEPCSSRTR